MRDILSAIFRFLSYELVSRPLLYYPGMVVVRLSRIFRKLFYSPGAPSEIRLVRFGGRLKMKVDRNSYMGGAIYWSGFHHLQELLYLNSRLLPNMTFVDVGSNQGEFSIFAASKVPKGKVLAFEPVSKNRSLLLDNIRLNSLSNVSVFDFGLSNQRGVLPIYTSLESGEFHGLHEGLSTLYPTQTRNILEETIHLEVFDDFFSENPNKIDFVKIDVEGAELFVLQGMKKFLIQFKPELLIEINNDTFKAAGYTAGDILTFLKSFGYQAYKIKKGRLQRISISDLSSWGNYIFKSEE